MTQKKHWGQFPPLISTDIEEVRSHVTTHLTKAFHDRISDFGLQNLVSEPVRANIEAVLSHGQPLAGGTLKSHSYRPLHQIYGARGHITTELYGGSLQPNFYQVRFSVAENCARLSCLLRTTINDRGPIKRGAIFHFDSANGVVTLDDLIGEGGTRHLLREGTSGDYDVSQVPVRYDQCTRRAIPLWTNEKRQVIDVKWLDAIQRQLEIHVPREELTRTVRHHR